MGRKTNSCPNGHGKMVLKDIKKTLNFRGKDITFGIETYLCEKCEIEVATIDQAANTQMAISEAYRKKVGLLTGATIKKKRKSMNLSQRELAEKMNVGIASIKRWEGGLIQSKSMDTALRLAFKGKTEGNTSTGNRDFSIPRIKLVLRHFEGDLRRKILKKYDKLLYAVKYAWYADMIAHRELGKSMTGASYAALPYGPQLNNYRDLVDEIKDADENSVEPLSNEEIRIINKISITFPTDSSIYDAAHREEIWKIATKGAIIPYSDSSRLTEI